jgi:hypothetical protein
MRTIIIEAFGKAAASFTLLFAALLGPKYGLAQTA